MHDAPEKDKKRQERLISFGIEFLRFYDSDIKDKLERVVRKIDAWIRNFEQRGENLHPPKSPFKGGLNISLNESIFNKGFVFTITLFLKFRKYF